MHTFNVNSKCNKKANVSTYFMFYHCSLLTHGLHEIFEVTNLTVASVYWKLLPVSNHDIRTIFQSLHNPKHNSLVKLKKDIHYHRKSNNKSYYKSLNNESKLNIDERFTLENGNTSNKTKTDSKLLNEDFN